MAEVAYLTGFDPRIFPRPIFFARATGAKVFSIRTLAGHLRNPNKRLEDFAKQKLIIKQKYINFFDFDLSKYINNCYRQDKTYIIGTLIKEASIAGFLKKLSYEYGLAVIKNLVGVLAARLAGMRVVVDLMDLWHCDKDYLVFSPLDFAALRKAECVIAWSRAIAALLRRTGLNCVEYLPFGVDLNVFDPLKADPRLIYERYPQLEGKVVVGYSGGGHVYHGIHKVLGAYRLVEKKNKDVVLAIQTWGQNQLVRDMIKRFNIESGVDRAHEALQRPIAALLPESRLDSRATCLQDARRIPRREDHHVSVHGGGQRHSRRVFPRRRGRTKRWTHRNYCEIRRRPQFSREDRAPHRSQ